MKQLLLIFAGGIVFGVGLASSRLIEQEVVLSFLMLDDLGLAVTMACAMLVTMPIYLLAPRRRRGPLLGGAFERFPRAVARHNVLGAIVFGVGWGLSGVCPGAAIGSLGAGNAPILTALAGMIAGAYVQGRWFGKAVTE